MEILFFFENTKSVTGLSFGVGLQVPFSAINDKGIIDFNLEYSNKGIEGDQDQIIFDLHYINFGAGLSHYFSEGRISPFIGGGATFGVQLTSIDKAYTRFNTLRNERVPLFSNVDPGLLEIGLEIRTGIRYKINNEHAVMGILKYASAQLPLNLIPQSYSARALTFQLAYVFL